MQISDFLGQYQTMLDNAAASSSSVKAEGTVEQNLVSTLTRLEAGMVFEGSIHSIAGSKVLLGLGNGQTIAARMESSMDLMLGQSVFFQVKSNDGKTIEIKPYTGNHNFNPAIQKALNAAGMEITKDTLDMVNHMMEQGMPIDKNSLASMYHTLLQNPGIPMQMAMAMSKLGIPVNAQMAAQFENYQNDRHALLSQMEQVTDALPGAYAKAAGQSADGLLQFNSQVLAILGDGIPKQDGANLFVAQLPETGQDAETVQASGADIQPESQPSADGVPSGQTAGAKADGVVPDANLANGQAVEESGTNLTDGQAIEEAGTKKETVSQPSAEEAAFPKEGAGGGQTLEELLSKKQLHALQSQLKQVFPEEKGQKLNTQLTAKEFLDSLAKQLESGQLQDGNKEAFSKLLLSKEYHTLLKDAAKQQWTLHPEDLKPGPENRPENKITELYHRLERQMGQLQQLADKAGMNTGQLSESAAQVRNNIEFMHQVNQMYTYVQIPLKLAGQNAHSDLYVYTNKRNLRNQRGELSAFLHLDLENLGSTDVSIKMLDQNVTTKFFLDDDASYDLIAEHLPELQCRLEKMGYHCAVSIEHSEKSVDFVEDFLKKGQPAKSASLGAVQRYSFDVRA